MDASIFIQIALGGILLGGLYAMVAFGLSLIYGVARILNFAHGTLLAVGGVAARAIFAATAWNPLLIMALLVPVFGIFGSVFYDKLLQPLTKRSHFEYTVGSVLVTVGALLILSDVAAWIAGPAPRNIPLRFEAMEFGDVIVSTTQVWILGGIIVFTTILHFYIKRQHKMHSHS